MERYNILITSGIVMINYDVEYAEDYKEIFANKFLASVRPGYFEIDIITDTIDYQESLETHPEDFKKNKNKHTIHAKLLIPLYHLLDLQGIINQLKPLYEKNYGELKLPKKAKAKEETQPTYVT